MFKRILFFFVRTYRHATVPQIFVFLADLLVATGVFFIVELFQTQDNVWNPHFVAVKLIEVLVALFITAVVFIGVYTAISVSLINTRYLQQARETSNFASQLAEGFAVSRDCEEFSCFDYIKQDYEDVPSITEIDLESITALNDGLIRYPETVLFTSHDHQFVQTSANRIIEITPEVCIDRQGTYEEFIEFKKNI